MRAPGTGAPGGGPHTAARALLLAQPGVLDGTVAERVTAAGERVLVGYVVADDPWQFRRPDAVSPNAGLPDLIVRVPFLPLTDDGAIDLATLSAMPSIDDELCQRAENLIRDLAGLREVRVTRDVAGEPLLRVADLVPASHAAPEPGADTAAREPGATGSPSAPSVASGGPLVAGAAAPRLLPDMLRIAASREPPRGITYVDGVTEIHQSYRELSNTAERVMAGLRAAGLRPGQYVILQLVRGEDFLAAYWGCVLGGFVPAALAVPAAFDAAGTALAKLRNVAALLEQATVITTESIAAEIRRIPALPVLTLETLSAHEPDTQWHVASPSDLAMLLLTSGSTGVPKAVTQTHEALLARSAGMALACDFSHEDVSLNWLPLDHVGGIVMSHLAFGYVGAAQVQVATDFVLQDPLRWLDLIDRFRVSYTWAPNFAFGLVSDRAADVTGRQWDLSCMRFALNGGEAVVARTARRFLKLLAPYGLPGTAMRPAWGMSETCSGVMVSNDFHLDTTSDDDHFVEVGRLIPGVTARLVNEHEEPVPEGSVGRLQVHGTCITRGYLNNAEATTDSVTSEGWLWTGDLARMVDGRFTITGREKGVIIINGANYHAHEIEAVVEEVGGVAHSYVAAFPVRERGGETDALALALHLEVEGDEALAGVLRHVRAIVRERIGVPVSYLLLVEREEIPKTGIGKIQHAALTRRFLAGGFEDAVRRSDHLLKAGDTLPSWFYRTTWRRRDVAPDSDIAGIKLVVLAADSPLSSAVLEQARTAGHQAQFVDAKAPGHVAGVMRALSTGPAALIVLRDPSSSAEGQASGAVDAVVSLLPLLRALGELDHQVRVVVAEHRVHHVQPGDVIDPDRSLLLGVLRTLPQEHPHLACRHVDTGSGAAAATAARLLDELADHADEPEVAYRDGGRWVRRIARTPPAPTRGAVVNEAGFLVVTGGLGGIAVEVARLALSQWRVPVLLLGRRSLEDDSERAGLLASLQSMGEVAYAAVDVAEPVQLAEAVADAGRRWQRPLAGVVHMAGAYAHRPLAAETPESFADICRGKVDGARALHQLLEAHPGAVFIASSSINGYFGGYGAGAYAAANAYLDALVQHRNIECDRPSWSLAWSLWNEVGMSRGLGLRDPAWRRGYHAITPGQGIASLRAVLAGQPGHVLIGLDGGNPRIRRHGMDDRTASLVAYCAAQDGRVLPPSLPLNDRFGAAVPVRTEMVADIATVGTTSGAAAAGWEATPVERTLGEIWRELLATDRIGPDDNFFDLGGNSLLIATASRRLRDALQREVPLTAIYRYPTLRQLAAHLSDPPVTDAPELQESATRGGTRRQKVLQRKRLRG
jgi:acyl-CoA synthetase (AMP-forming)/AMP-acid ligase II/NADP-dependent 3-hydroxy acid dehydrogenase YdfG